jgi:hypothetical protein
VRWCDPNISERGVNAHLRKKAGIPAGFERWYANFRAEHDIAWAYKTMLHKIAELEGGCEKCGRLTSCDSDHKTSCVLYRPLIEQAQQENKNGSSETKIDMKQTANAHYADRYALLGLLANALKDANPQEIFGTMRQEAIAAHQDLDAELASKIKVPKLVKLPDAEYTALKNKLRVIKDENDSLKQHFAAISECPSACGTTPSLPL